MHGTLCIIVIKHVLTYAVLCNVVHMHESDEILNSATELLQIRAIIYLWDRLYHGIIRLLVV